MGIYIYNILSIPFYGVLVKNKKYFCFLAGLQLFLILALRDITVGMDLGNYAGGYEYISTLSFFDMLSRFHFIKTADLVYPYSYEGGYMVLNWIIGKLGFSFHGFLVICAAITIISICTFVYKYSKKPWLSIVLFVALGGYGYAFGILRQTLAISIGLYSLEAILQRKWKKTLLIIVLAFLVHRTAVLFIPLYFLVNIKVKKTTMAEYLAGCLVFMFFAPRIYRNVVIRILVIFGKASYSNMSFRLNNLIILFFAIVVLLLIFVDFKLLCKPIDRLIIWAFLLAIPLEIVGMCNDAIARSVEYYYLFIILLVPNILVTYGGYLDEKKVVIIEKAKRYSLKNTKYVLECLLVVMMLWFMIHGLRGTPMLPYKLY